MRSFRIEAHRVESESEQELVFIEFNDEGETHKKVTVEMTPSWSWLLVYGHIKTYAENSLKSAKDFCRRVGVPVE